MKQLLNFLEIRLKEKLPGIEAHKKMAPTYRKITFPSADIIKNARKAATLLLLYEKNGLVHFVLIERVTYKGVHSGQIAFPGGRKDETDKSFAETALRETEEEIGIKQNDIKLLGKLTNVYIPPSNFYVEPYVGFYTGENINFKAQETEVAKIIEVNLTELTNKNAIQLVDMKKNDVTFNVPAFVLEKCTVWGATAIMLSEFLEIINEFENN